MIKSKQIKYIVKVKPKDKINIYDKFSLIDDKLNQIIKIINEKVL